MNKERLIIYTKDNKTETEFVRLKDEAQIWGEKSKKDTSVIIAVTEGSDEDVRIWKHNGLTIFLHGLSLIKLILSLLWIRQ